MRPLALVGLVVLVLGVLAFIVPVPRSDTQLGENRRCFRRHHHSSRRETLTGSWRRALCCRCGPAHSRLSQIGITHAKRCEPRGAKAATSDQACHGFVWPVLVQLLDLPGLAMGLRRSYYHHCRVGDDAANLPLLGYLATHHQYRHYHRDFPDGLSDPEHAKS